MSENAKFIIFFILLGVVLPVCLYISSHKKHHSRVEFPVKGKGIAYVYLYTSTRYGQDQYKKYKFIRTDKGKWKYDLGISKKKLLISYVACTLVLEVMCFIFLLEENSRMDAFWFLACPLLVLVGFCILFGTIYFLALEAYCVLMKYYKNNKKKEIRVDSEATQTMKKEKLFRGIKLLVKLILFLLWFVILCGISTLLVILGIDIVSLLQLKMFFPNAFLATLAMALFGGLVYSWIILLKPIMGNYSYVIPGGFATKWKKYRPEKVLKKLAEHRSNVILFNTRQAKIRIYGCGNDFVLEVRMRGNDEDQTFHLIDPDMDSIMPVSDEAPVVIENRWHEKLPVRKCWLVSEETICRFLTKLYECKEWQLAKEGFTFLETTEDIQKLIEADCYIVPEIPADWPLGGLKSNLGQEWLQKKEERVQRALKLLSGV